ncbi:MAG: MATE family efflux transporter [Butyrivibrio sp.]|nr:MATE family efflux transporter [Butyrivibrio sp.]
MANIENTNKNPLGVAPVEKLLRSFAVPSIISMLVGSLYNIVDQFFIGQKVGELGNAATNIAFPLSISCIAIALLFGIGGASAFNLAMGEGNREKAKHYMGNSAVISILCGIVLAVIAEILLRPMLIFFGSSVAILPYAMEYTRITAIGFPMLIFTSTGGHLIRADGRPRISMICNLSGAVINTVLDAIFVFGLGWGMQGAAIATVIGQYVSGSMAIWYLSHGKTVQLGIEDLKLKKEYILRPMSLGMAPCSNQLAMMLVQIVMNNSLRHYGINSEYGAETPIAVVGIITKVNSVFMSFVIGMSQGLQPISSFNYGAKNYKRVREAYLKTISVGAVMAEIAWLLFMIFPMQIISIFGKGENELYYKFAVNYFHIFLFFTFLNFLQPITSNFFTSIGKAKTGTFLSLTRQIIFLLPLILILPLFMGIDGIMYAGPVADLAAATVSGIMVGRELGRIKKLQA